MSSSDPPRKKLKSTAPPNTTLPNLIPSSRSTTTDTRQILQPDTMLQIIEYSSPKDRLNLATTCRFVADLVARSARSRKSHDLRAGPRDTLVISTDLDNLRGHLPTLPALPEEYALEKTPPEPTDMYKPLNEPFDRETPVRWVHWSHCSIYSPDPTEYIPYFRLEADTTSSGPDTKGTQKLGSVVEACKLVSLITHVRHDRYMPPSVHRLNRSIDHGMRKSVTLENLIPRGLSLSRGTSHTFLRSFFKTLPGTGDIDFKKQLFGDWPSKIELDISGQDSALDEGIMQVTRKVLSHYCKIDSEIIDMETWFRAEPCQLSGLLTQAVPQCTNTLFIELIDVERDNSTQTGYRQTRLRTEEEVKSLVGTIMTYLEAIDPNAKPLTLWDPHTGLLGVSIEALRERMEAAAEEKGLGEKFKKHLRMCSSISLGKLEDSKILRDPQCQCPYHSGRWDGDA